MNDIDGLELEIVSDEFGPDRPLNIVPAANPIDIGVAPIGDLGCGIGGRKHRQHRVLINLRGGEGYA